MRRLLIILLALLLAGPALGDEPASQAGKASDCDVVVHAFDFSVIGDSATIIAARLLRASIALIYMYFFDLF